MSSAGTIQVSGVAGITFTVSRAATALQESGTVILSGINSGIPNVVQAAELLKHRVKGLHQLNVFEKVADSNKTKVTITLSIAPLDTLSKGYQPPIPEVEVQSATFDELKARPQRAPREERKTPANPVAEGEETAKAPPSSSTRRGRNRSRRVRGRNRGRGARNAGDREPRASQPRQPSAAPANKFRKVRPPKSTEPPALVPGELHISPKRPTKYYVKDAVLWFKKQGNDKILLKASGWAIGHAVAAAEDIKRAVSGLHQIASFSKRTVVDEYEPTEVGLEKVTKERTIPALEIQLSIRQLNSSDPGYQTPLPESLIKEMSVAEAEAIA